MVEVYVSIHKKIKLYIPEKRKVIEWSDTFNKYIITITKINTDSVNMKLFIALNIFTLSPN